MKPLRKSAMTTRCKIMNIFLIGESLLISCTFSRSSGLLLYFEIKSSVFYKRAYYSLSVTSKGILLSLSSSCNYIDSINLMNSTNYIHLEKLPKIHFFFLFQAPEKFQFNFKLL